MKFSICDMRRVISGKVLPCLWGLMLLFMSVALSGCGKAGAEQKAVEATIMRYNQLLVEGYRKLNMNPLQEVATPEQATKLYYHMSALGEGRLRMESTLKEIKFIKVEFPKPDEATVETKEKWDFAHINISTGQKYAEERDFIYVMGYFLKKDKGRWIIQNINTVSGESTNTVLSWPETDRKGNLPPSGQGK